MFSFRTSFRMYSLVETSLQFLKATQRWKYLYFVNWNFERNTIRFYSFSVLFLIWFVILPFRSDLTVSLRNDVYRSLFLSLSAANLLLRISRRFCSISIWHILIFDINGIALHSIVRSWIIKTIIWHNVIKHFAITKVESANSNDKRMDGRKKWKSWPVNEQRWKKRRRWMVAAKNLLVGRFSPFCPFFTYLHPPSVSIFFSSKIRLTSSIDRVFLANL